MGKEVGNVGTSFIQLCCTSYRLTTGYTFTKNTVSSHHCYTDNSVFAGQHRFLMAFLFSSHVVHFRALQPTPEVLIGRSSHYLRYTFSKLHTLFSPLLEILSFSQQSKASMIDHRLFPYLYSQYIH